LAARDDLKVICGKVTPSERKALFLVQPKMDPLRMVGGYTICNKLDINDQRRLVQYMDGDYFLSKMTVSCDLLLHGE